MPLKCGDFVFRKVNWSLPLRRCRWVGFRLTAKLPLSVMKPNWRRSLSECSENNSKKLQKINAECINSKMYIASKWHTGIPELWTQKLDAGLWTLDDEVWTLDAGWWDFHPLDCGSWNFKIWNCPKLRKRLSYISNFILEFCIDKNLWSFQIWKFLDSLLISGHSF